MGRRGYSLKDKKTALEALKANDFNFNKTAKGAGIAVSTLKKWNREYGKEVFGNHVDIEIVTQKQAEIAMRNAEPLRTKAESVLEKVLNEMEKRLTDNPSEIKFNSLILAVDKIANYTLPKIQQDKGKGEGDEPSFLEVLYAYAGHLRQQNKKDNEIGNTTVRSIAEKSSGR